MGNTKYPARLSIVALLLPVITETMTSNLGEMQDYCETDTFHARCNRAGLVVMLEAKYGRMALGTCLTVDLGFMGCFSDILPHMDTLCSGRTSCDIDVIDLLEVTNPCPDLRSYLQASFTCIPVAQYGNRCCQLPNDKVRVTAGEGQLASVMTFETGCGRRDCPLQLEAPPGKRINISIIDFGTRWQAAEHCHLYATIDEEATRATTAVCRGGPRKRHIYSSDTNSVLIYINDQNGEDYEMSHFILEYKAFGCADPSFPINGYIERDGHHAIVTCPGPNGVTWEIVCQDGQWLGNHKNCSLDTSKNGGEKNPNDVFHIKSRMVIILIVAVAVIVAIVILLFGVMCVLHSVRNSNRQRARNGQTEVCRQPINRFNENTRGCELQRKKIDKNTNVDQRGDNWNTDNAEHVSLSSLLHSGSSANYTDFKYIPSLPGKYNNTLNRGLPNHNNEEIRNVETSGWKGQTFKNQVP